MLLLIHASFTVSRISWKHLPCKGITNSITRTIIINCLIVKRLLKNHVQHVVNG